jgi:outer membrane protein TolC
MPSAGPSENGLGDDGKTAGAVAIATPRFYFSPGNAGECDESVLARWWEHAGLDGLGKLVEAFLAQSIDLSRARMEMEQRVAMCAASADGRSESSLEPAMHSLISHMAEFQDIRVNVIAKLSATYVRFLILSERIRNTEHSIALHQSIADRRSHERSDGGERNHAGRSPSSPIAELHAFRETLNGDLNAALLALSEQLCEPASITCARIDGHCLPANMASAPNVGSPAALASRRPDLMALEHCVLRQENGGDSAHLELRLAQLNYEQACVAAITAVDHAINRIITATASLVPARACAANADANARAAQADLRRGNSSMEAVSYAHVARFNFNDREIVIRGETYLALVQLFQALGGGWESEDFMLGETSAEGAA